MDTILILLVQSLSSVAGLALIGAGLAIIFGMMKVMNLAHGEFLMLGAYSVLVSMKLGINMFVAMFIIAPLFVGLIGAIVERLIVRRLYGRIVDTLLATWGLSLFLVGVVTTFFGNTMEGISTPFGSFRIGELQDSNYKFFIIFVGVALSVSIYIFLKYTKWGLVARSTMSNPEQASALGVNPDRVYTITFAMGAALTGLAGAVLAPISGVLPTMGAAYVAKAFIVVIAGGEAILAGLVSASALFGSVNHGFTYLTSPVIGEVALLGAAVVLLRFMPEGITGRIFKRSI